MLLIYNARLVDKNIDIKNSAVLIEKNKIAGFPSKTNVQMLLKDPKVSSFNARGLTLMPSFIDMHAHFRDPGLTQKEDIETGSKAAAAGGYGLLVLMPNTSPVVSSQEAALANDKKAADFGFADVIQSVSITKDFDGKTISHLEELNAKSVPVITEDGKEVADSDIMFRAMCTAAKKKLIVACHCEDPSLAAAARPLRKEALEQAAADKGRAVKLLKQADEILQLAEDCATFRNIRLAEQSGCRLHLCHVSTAKCIEAVHRAKKEGIKVTCEITPHHLGLSENKTNIFHIVNPPLRSESDRKALVKALLDGTADVISTDHAPHTLEDKAAGSPGFSGLETSFAVCNTVLVKQNGMKLKKLSELMSAKPAEILGIKDRGLLQEGFDASLVLVDPDKQWTVRGEEFASKGKYTPLEGKKLTGTIAATFLHGKIVYQE